MFSTQPLQSSVKAIIVGNIPQECDEQYIFNIFQRYGPIIDLNLRPAENAVSLFQTAPTLRARIVFQFEESAVNAINYSRGFSVLDKVLIVNWEQNAPNVGPSRSPLPLDTYSQMSRLPFAQQRVKRSGKTKDAQIHFSYVTSRATPVTEETLHNVFSNFGNLIEIVMKKAEFNRESRVQTGYGFVHFPLTEEGIASAMQAVNCLNGFVLDAVKYSCKISRTLDDYFKAQQGNQLPQEANNFNASPFPSSTLSQPLPIRRPPASGDLLLQQPAPSLSSLSLTSDEHLDSVFKFPESLLTSSHTISPSSFPSTEPQDPFLEFNAPFFFSSTAGNNTIPKDLDFF